MVEKKTWLLESFVTISSEPGKKEVMNKRNTGGKTCELAGPFSLIAFRRNRVFPQLNGCDYGLKNNSEENRSELTKE